MKRTAKLCSAQPGRRVNRKVIVYSFNPSSLWRSIDIVANCSCEFLHTPKELYDSILGRDAEHGKYCPQDTKPAPQLNRGVRSWFDTPWQPLLIADFQAVCNTNSSWRYWLKRETAECGSQQRSTINRQRPFP